MRRMRRAATVAVVVLVSFALSAPGQAAVPAGAAATVPRAPVPTGAAPGGPGTLSHFDLARKDCVGTAAGRTSKVWYTIANGVLSDVYSPTVDNTDVESMQFIVTDGSTFTDVQTRDTSFTVRSLDRSGMACEVI